ncbi:MAG TPA: hypothetical protein P5509_06940 [Bacteroidales bacterium]|nr:hypothetical protein [Bacteroidales bacterium]
MPKIKTYTLKKEFPGGYKKGDKVTDRGTGVWYWERTQVHCPYDPAKETAFFAKFVEPKYCVLEQVRLIPATMGRKNCIRNVGSKTELIISKRIAPENDKGEYRYTLRLGTKEIGTFMESEIYKPKLYWFINSRGTVCSETIVPNDTSLAYRYRKATNNVFMTKEDARNRLNNILNPKL